MKKLMMIAMGVMLLAACGKDRQCKCVYTGEEDDNSLKFMYVDHSMKCASITDIAEEVRVVDSTTVPPVHSLSRIEHHKVSCREYGE